MRSDEDLDRLLDGALASYANAEPRPGLERRVLAQVRHAGKGLRWAWAWLVPAAAVAAAAVMMMWGGFQPARDFSPALPPLPAPPAMAFITRPGGTEVPRRVKPPQAPPQRPVFPIPAPLTSEERTLLAIARNPERLIEVAHDLHDSAEPIHIRQIHIEPLDAKGQ